MKSAVRCAAWLVIVAGTFVVGLSLAGLRLSLEGAHAMRLSDREFDQGRLRESLLFARRAASLVAPRLRHVGDARARLDAIAVGAEAASRRETAILAWQSIRSVEVLRPNAGPVARLATANQRLAVLLGDDGRRTSMIESQQLSRRVLRALEQPRRSSLPTAGGAIVVLLGIALVCLGLGGRGGRVLVWAGGSLAGFGAIGWAILLSLA